MSATDSNQEEGDLIPLSSRVIKLFYGGEEYIRSVFGTSKITRRQIAEYYANAQASWIKVPIKWAESWRNQIHPWLKANNIGQFDYYFPMGREAIWFKHEHDAFAFTLKFGIIDKNYHFQYN